MPTFATITLVYTFSAFGGTNRIIIQGGVGTGREKSMDTVGYWGIMAEGHKVPGLLEMIPKLMPFIGCGSLRVQYFSLCTVINLLILWNIQQPKREV